MILFQNGLIKLNYDPATDILSVDMPHVSYEMISEFKRALDIIVENIKNYDVKKLLVDARKSIIELDPDVYAAVVAEFSRQLNNTRLQKGARVVSNDKLREQIVQKSVDEGQPGLIYQTFTDTSDAMAWLMQ